jgi:hypothetical protein
MGIGDSTVVVIVVAMNFRPDAKGFLVEVIESKLPLAARLPFPFPVFPPTRSEERGRPVTGSRFSLSSIVTVEMLVVMRLGPSWNTCAYSERTPSSVGKE